MSNRWFSALPIEERIPRSLTRIPRGTASRTPEALLLRSLSLYPKRWFSAGEYAKAINGARAEAGMSKVSRSRIMNLLLDWVRSGAVEVQWTSLLRDGAWWPGRVYRARG